MFLIEHQRQLVTREQIAEALWGKDVFVDVEQGINTAIRKIRLALEDNSAQPQYLQTVVGGGYRFVASPAQRAAPPVSEVGEAFRSCEEFGRAIMAAAGIDPDNPKRRPKFAANPKPRIEVRNPTQSAGCTNPGESEITHESHSSQATRWARGNGTGGVAGSAAEGE